MTVTIVMPNGFNETIHSECLDAVSQAVAVLADKYGFCPDEALRDVGVIELKHHEDLVLPITENDTRRKKVTGVKVSMPPDGKCPYLKDGKPCPYVCKSLHPPTFSSHITKYHAKETGRPVDPFMCSKCNKKFGLRTDLNQHVCRKSTEPKIKIDCPYPECRHQGTTKGGLIAHYVVNHMKKELKDCKQANKCLKCDGKLPKDPKNHIGTCYPNWSDHWKSAQKCEECD